MNSFFPLIGEEAPPPAARLGISLSAAPEAGAAGPSLRDAGHGVVAGTLFRSSAIAILVADSRPMVVRGLTELINARKPLMEVVAAASDYARTVELSESLRPEVILFSFFRDAIDAIEALAALIHRSKAKVLLIKGQGDAALIGRALDMGARGVVLAEDTGESIAQAIVRVSHAPIDPATAWLGGMAGLPVPTRIRALHHDVQHAQTSRLTARERQLISAIVSQPSAKYMTIGAVLGISEHTVHNHLTSIYRKLGLVNRIELLVYATRHLIDGNGGPARQFADPG